MLLWVDYRADGTTQEAGLFRRTNLYQCLDTEPRRSEFYPLPSQGAVYCPNMIVLRKSSLENDEFMDRPEWMSFLVRTPPSATPNFGYAISDYRAQVSDCSFWTIYSSLGYGASSEPSTGRQRSERDDLGRKSGHYHKEKDPKHVQNRSWQW